MTRGLTLPSWREWVFSLKAFVASMLALYIALCAGLDRPYWAMAAVYVVANPLSGATTSKALYRALGTFIGAAGSILLLPMFSNAPELFITVVGLWTGLFLFVSLLDRTPRGYVFMLAGYSLPLIALPAAGAPDTIFAVAVARAEEITLGIVCAAIVNSLFFPTRVGPVLAAQVGGWLRDAGAWAAALLSGRHGQGATPERQRLAADIRSMDMLISQLGYDAANHDTVRSAHELRGRMALLLPILSSLDDRIAALREAGEESTDFIALKRDVLAWMQGSTESDPSAIDALVHRIAALEPSGVQATRWAGLLLSSALERLKELVDLWADCRELRRRIEHGDRAGRWRPVYRSRRTVGKARHYDLGLLAFSAASVTLATMVSGFVWIYTGWPEGAGCMIMTAVGCSFFAAVDDPASQIRSFTLWMAVSVAASAVYLFALLPLAHDFAGLVALFAMPFIVVGTLVSRPQFTMIAMLLAVNTASFVGLQASYSAQFDSFINGNIASVAGGVFALVWTLAFRPFGAAFVARRLIRAGWADIAATSHGGRNEDPERFAGRVFDRLGQLVPRLVADKTADMGAADLLQELRVGINVLDLQRLHGDLPSGGQPILRDVLEAVAQLYGERAASGRALPAHAELLASIDTALAAFARQLPEGALRRQALQALVGLRRGLFADAPPPAALLDAAREKLELPELELAS